MIHIHSRTPPTVRMSRILLQQTAQTTETLKKTVKRLNTWTARQKEKLQPKAKRRQPRLKWPEAKGKKKPSSSDESSKSTTPNSNRGTPRANTSFTITKTPQSQKQNSQPTPSVTKPPGWSVNKKPAIVNPGAGTPKSGARTAKTRPAIVQPVSSKTLKTRKTPTTTTPKTPGLFSPGPNKLVASAGRKQLLARKSGGKTPTPVNNRTSQKKSTPRSGSQKNTPRNGDENTQKSSGKKRKRTNTFELEEATLGAPATPDVSESASKKIRSGTPDVQEMLDSMSGEISSAERRQRLMSALDKKVEGKVKKSPGPVTQIPRFAAFLAKKRQGQKKPITPGNKDWDKIHKKNFSKLDSIDVYLEKKRKRAEEMSASVKKARTVLTEVQEAVSKLKSKRTPSLGKAKAEASFKPMVLSTKEMNLNFGTSKTPSGENRRSASKPFKPTVTSTKNMNLNFSSLKTPVNQNRKAASVQTPAANASTKKSVGAAQASARKSIGANKSLATTPFHFTGNHNNSTLNTTAGNKSTTKSVFDLKASLSRPITWKPHAGKLKPIDTMYTAPEPVSCRMDVFKSAVNKTRVTYSRHDRRAAMAAKRADAKNNLQMKKRGLTAAK